MGVRIAVTRERREGETRVAATPDSVRKLIALGGEVRLEAGAGAASSYPAAASDAVKTADILLKVRDPADVELAALAPGAIVVGLLDPFNSAELIDALNQVKATAIAMEFVPRISRAQTMAALSSQANLAGYRAVIEAAEAYGRALPMMMTAAGP